MARSTEIGAWASLLAVAVLLPRLGGLAAEQDRLVLPRRRGRHRPPEHGARRSGSWPRASARPRWLLFRSSSCARGIGVALLFRPGRPPVHAESADARSSRASAPARGSSEIFSTQGAWSLGKTVLKLGILAGLGYVLLRHLMGSELGGADAAAGRPPSASPAPPPRALLRDIGVVALFVAAADYAFQRRSYQQGLRMTKQEVKDESRRNDGSPEVRRALRSKARQLSRLRMMAAVASADVVVTNPTHFAVAIAYDRKKDRAPRVVAKGADVLAARIRSRAAEHGVPVVENPLLARTLHASCQVDDVVPDCPLCGRGAACLPSSTRSRPRRKCSAQSIGWPRPPGAGCDGLSERASDGLSPLNSRPLP